MRVSKVGYLITINNIDTLYQSAMSLYEKHDFKRLKPYLKRELIRILKMIGECGNMECEYKNKYGRCEIDDYNCFYKNQEKIEQCKERKENDNKFDKK